MLPESSKSSRKKKTNIRSCHLQENPLVLEAQTFQIWQSALNQKYEQTFILICLHICQKTVENRVMPSRSISVQLNLRNQAWPRHDQKFIMCFKFCVAFFSFISISRSPRAQNCNDQNSERRLCIVLIHQTSNRIDFDSMK